MLHLPDKVDLAIDVPETRTRLDARLYGNDEPGAGKKKTPPRERGRVCI